MSSPHAVPLRRSSLFAVFLTIFLDLVGFGMFIPVLVTVATDLGASPARAASINTWHSIGTLASVILLGRLSDRLGRKPVLVATIALSAAAQLATGYAGSLGLLIAARFVAGAAAGNISVAQACISDLTPRAKRASAMAIIGIAFGGGFAIGPAFGALISRWAGQDFLMAIGWVSCALNIINLVFVSRLLVESHPRFQSPEVRHALALEPTDTSQATGIDPGRPSSDAPLARQSIFKDFAALTRIKPLRILFVMQFLQVFGFVGLETILPLVLRDEYGFSKTRTYDAFVVMGMAVLLFNGVIARRVLLHMDERLAIKIGQGLLCLGIAGVHLVAPAAVPLYVALAIMSCGTAFANPSISSLTSKLCPSTQVGMTFGALQVVSTAARILGPLGMGFLYQVAEGSRSLWGTVVFIALASVLAWLLPKPRQTGTA